MLYIQRMYHHVVINVNCLHKLFARMSSNVCKILVHCSANARASILFVLQRGYRVRDPWPGWLRVRGVRSTGGRARPSDWHWDAQLSDWRGKNQSTNEERLQHGTAEAVETLQLPHLCMFDNQLSGMRWKLKMLRWPFGLIRNNLPKN